jgi:hypothetical protein
VVHFVLASSIWLQEGPPLTDLIAIVKAHRNAAIFAVVLSFLTGGGRTTARERTCASSTPNSEAWSTRPATAAPRNEERRLAEARALSSMKIAPGLTATSTVLLRGSALRLEHLAWAHATSHRLRRG